MKIEIRLFDILFSMTGIIVLWPIAIVIILLGIFDTGSPIFIQTRVGKNRKPFKLIKFRTMSLNTKSVATHLANSHNVTRIGEFLRKTKLDELPQLVNVFLGQMSLVGPRPNLYNQEELIREREKKGVYDYLPGITGLAQINEIDMSTPKLLAETDAGMLNNLKLKSYFFYIFLTITGKGQGDRVKNNYE